MTMETTEILRRLYGVRPKKHRRGRSVRRLKKRVTRWIRQYNWSLVLVALGAGLWFLTHIYYYNNLVSLEFDVLAARAEIEASQQKRHHIQVNIISLLHFYEGYERQLTTEVTEMRAHTEDPAAATATEESPISSLVGRLNAVAEAYPALRLTEIVQRFVEAVVMIETEIAMRISQYNIAVNVYTTVMRQFPGIIFATSLGFEERPFWEPKERDSLRYGAVEL
ncbi:MAG: hypothetical protein DRJ42_28890 [Deltaproteobacteria bacterium]|nr:MAG: hypothetical protein DRJ42_28890 [Deltaproteobacteria bacterium]